MTKIVFNQCYGGFGLSHRAILRYAEIKGLSLTYQPYKNTHLMNYYVGEEHFFPRDIPRNDPALAQVVEELGKDANGDFAELSIVDLPSGTRYRIEEYDGSESVCTEDEYIWQIA